MNIQEEISKVRKLEQEYLSNKYISNNQNSLKSIKAFNDWHSAASVLFTLSNLENDKNFIKFQEENTGGNAYVLASVYDIIHSPYEILMAKVENGINTSMDNENKLKIFISHSSKDRNIVKLFIDNFLKKGLSLTDNDIACTSFEATGVAPGENIPLYIKQNIKGSKLCLAMVSKNYKASEVCMNEVGAAWALERPPIQIVLPNTDFSELGWLLNTDKAAKIDDEDSLDHLMVKICNVLNIPEISALHWNPCKRDLLESIKQICDETTNSDSRPILLFPNRQDKITISPIYRLVLFGSPLTANKKSGSVFDEPFVSCLTNKSYCPINIVLINEGGALENVNVKIEGKNVTFATGNLDKMNLPPSVFSKFSIEDGCCYFDLGLFNAKSEKKLDTFYIKSTEIEGVYDESECLKIGEPKEVCLKYTISTKEKPYYGELRVIIKAKAQKAFSSDKQLIGKIKLEELKE